MFVLVGARAVLESSVKPFLGLAGSDFNFTVTCGHFIGVSLCIYTISVVAVSPVSSAHVQLRPTVILSVFMWSEHERGNKTSGTPWSTLTVAIHGTNGVDLCRYQLHAW